MTPEELKDWLEARPRTTRAQEANWIAARAAARVLPDLLRLYGINVSLDRSGLQCCRCILISWVAALYATPKTGFAVVADLAASAITKSPSNLSMFDVDTVARASAAAADAALSAVVAYSADPTDTARADRAIRAAYAAARDASLSSGRVETSRAAVSADIALVENGDWNSTARPLWLGQIPGDIAETWDRAKTQLLQDQTADWQFWVDWYNALLEGREQDLEMLAEIALFGDADWNQGPSHVNAMIAAIVEAKATGTPLARAYPVDFSFDSLLKVMRLVGIDDDTAHLRDAGFVQRFQDDCEELRDTLQNFTDYAQAKTGGGNFAGVLRLAADKVLNELARIEETDHVRARYLVTLGNELDAFSKEQSARDDLGETLAGILDNGLTLLRTVTRQHFAPSYTALAPLGQLTLAHIEQGEVIALLDDMLEHLKALPDDRLVALDHDGLSVLSDMVRETKDFRAGIAEATSDEFREMLEGRLAASLGGTGLAFNRFLEESSDAARKVNKSAGTVIDSYKKAQSLADIFNALKDFLSGGPPV